MLTQVMKSPPLKRRPLFRPLAWTMSVCLSETAVSRVNYQSKRRPISARRLIRHRNSRHCQRCFRVTDQKTVAHDCVAAATNAHHPDHFRGRCRSGRQRPGREFFRSRAATSPVSPLWSRRCLASGWSCSRRLRRASTGPPFCSTRQWRHMPPSGGTVSIMVSAMPSPISQLAESSVFGRSCIARSTRCLRRAKGVPAIWGHRYKERDPVLCGQCSERPHFTRGQPPSLSGRKA